MEFVQRSQIIRRPKQRCSNVYVPPPARKSSGQECGAFERTASTRPNTYDETKACNDSSLLFVNDKGRLYTVQKPRSKLKSKNLQLRKHTLEKEGHKQVEDNGGECSVQVIQVQLEDNTSSLNKTNLITSEENSDCIANYNKVSDNDISAHSSSSGSYFSDEDTYFGDRKVHVDDIIVSPNDKNASSKLNAFAENILLEIVELEDSKDISLSCEDKDVTENKALYSQINKRYPDNQANLSTKELNLKDDRIPLLLSNNTSVLCGSRSCRTTDKNLTIEENDWETLYDESGECLADSKLHVEAKPSDRKSDSSEFQEKEETENSGSIIEVYGFSQDFKTNDIMTVLSAYTTRGLKLSWVDDTHALAIFPSPSLADEVLACDLPLVRTRPLSQATTASQEKARHLVLPSTLRPKTCPLMAKRLVSGALGLKMVASPEARAAEKEILRKAREEKKLAAKQRDAAWEGVFDRYEI